VFTPSNFLAPVFSTPLFEKYFGNFSFKISADKPS